MGFNSGFKALIIFLLHDLHMYRNTNLDITQELTDADIRVGRCSLFYLLLVWMCWWCH